MFMFQQCCSSESLRLPTSSSSTRRCIVVLIVVGVILWQIYLEDCAAAAVATTTTSSSCADVVEKETEAAGLLHLPNNSNQDQDNNDNNNNNNNNTIAWAYDPWSRYELVDCQGLGAFDTDKNNINNNNNDIYLFVITNLFSLGHMQPPFVQFFAWLHRLSQIPPSQRPPTVYATYEKPNPKELKNVKEHYYEPMRQEIIRYFEEKHNLHVQFLPQQLSLAYESCRQLPLELFHHITSSQPDRVVRFAARCFGKGGVDWIGGCPAWFPNPETVREWRQFLDYGPHVPSQITQLSQSSSQESNNEPSSSALMFQVLVFDRDKGYKRSFQNPQQVVDVTQQACPRCNVQYYEFQGKREGASSWQWNCEFFAGYDLIILTHGAACSNFVCMKQGAGVLEIVPRQQQNKGSISMYAPLADQLLLHHSAVPFATGHDNFEAPIQPDTAALETAVREVYAKLLLESSR